MGTIYQFSAKTLDGQEKPLSDYEGKVLLVVNTASKCGFTPQYQGLEALHRQYHSLGFAVLGFPCNQFGAQEPGDALEIAQFCRRNYDVTFPLFGQIDVNGAGAIKWNFTKFLVNRMGEAADRFSPAVAPADLEKHSEKLL